LTSALQNDIKENMTRLRESIAQLNAGKAKERKLIDYKRLMYKIWHDEA
jgi:hypothetical protein